MSLPAGSRWYGRRHSEERPMISRLCNSISTWHSRCAPNGDQEGLVITIDRCDKAHYIESCGNVSYSNDRLRRRMNGSTEWVRVVENKNV